jgi:RNA polymerase sigma-70 factor (ECF subfamily)
VDTMLASDLPWQELHVNLRAFIARRVRNQADVDDLVQRVLLQIVKGLGSLRDADRVHAWVYRTARNVIVDYYRSAGSRREHPAGDGADLEAAEPPAAPTVSEEDDGAALRELAACLSPMLARLSPAAQEAIRLVDLEGATQVEAARQVGLSLSGMKSRVQRGRQELRAVLEACCRIDLDARKSITAYTARHPDACGCGGCGEA